MLIDCGHMGLDPGSLSLSGYLEALAAYNAAHDPDADGPPAEASPELRAFMKAHGTMQ